MENEIKYGLSLSGGGARAFVQLGAVQALHEANIYPRVFAGTSMGAVMGAFLAAGKSPQEIRDIFKMNISKFSFSWLTLLRKSHKSMNMLSKIFTAHFQEDSFEHLKYPFYLSVTNLNTGRNQIIFEGKLFDFLIASVTIPVIFKPKVIGGNYYVDGGLTNNFPARILQTKCDKLIGIHVNYISEVKNFTILSLAERLYQVGVYSTVHNKIHLCDYFMDPPECRNFDTFDFAKIDQIYGLGYRLGLDFAKGILDDAKKL